MDEYKFFWPNSICIPGARSLFVSTDGTFYPCENLYDHNPLVLGNVSEGLFFEKIEKLIEEYSKKSTQHCTNCWAYRLCDLCYVASHTNVGYSEKRKALYCNNMKSTLINSFKNYLTIIEKNPSAFDYLDNIGKD
jgi:uncharacterized protein